MGVLALLLFLATGLCDSQCHEDTSIWISTFGLFALITLSTLAVFFMVRQDPDVIWTPAALFPLGTLLFFGFGSLSVFFSNEMTQRHFQAGSYGLDAAGLIRTQLLTTTGVAVCAAFIVIGSRIQFGKPRASIRNARLSLPAIAIFFVASGAVLKYGLVLPEQWGLINIAVPGTLKSMTGIIDLGLAVMTYMSARGRKVWLLVFLLIWPVHLGLCLLELSKRVTMFAILIPALGAYLGHRSWKRVLLWVAFAAVVFATLQAINTEARQDIKHKTGSIGQANFSERVDLLRAGFSANSDAPPLTSAEPDTVQIWWLRLNYSGPQLQAMELYDSGRPGEWTLSFLATLVPRFVWPGKPESTARGRIFNQTVSGNTEATTRVGISVYADGYWIMGWPGAIMFSAIMGTILGVVTRINYRLIVSRQLTYLPVVFLGMTMAALGPMGYLEKSFVGALPIYFGYLLVINIATRLRLSAPRGNSPSIASVNRYAP
ncbi:MAG: hypothetical protein ACJA09_000906 [Alcanivorax sp.]|jgi:hypothetical protein